MKESDLLITKLSAIDKKIADLFIKRMGVSREVALYKKQRGIEIEDSIQENYVIDSNLDFIQNEELKAYYINFLKNTIEISKKYQHRVVEGMRVACSGVEGAFAHIAARKVFPVADFEFYTDFESAYKSVEDGACDCCVLPLENSYAGEVTQVTDLIYSGNLFINGVYDLEICHNLLGLKNAEISDIKTVVSHPQALSQCEGYIRKHGFKEMKETNTAISAKFVSDGKDKTVAAIASRETAELYGLKILDHHINESTFNTTRFAVFSRVENVADNDDSKFIMVFTVRNEAGALAKAIKIIGEYGFNMRVLRSRPVKDEPWHYYFYVEAEGNPHGEKANKMIERLESTCTKVKIAGSFQMEKKL